MARKYSSTSIETTLATSISNSATTMEVAANTATTLLGGVTLAAGNVDQFTVVLDPSTVNEEIVFITGVLGDTFTIQRAKAGTSGISHSAGAKIQHVLTSDDLYFFRDGTTTADAAVPKATVTTKGDLIAATANATVTRVPVGSNGYVLTANTTATAGIAWAAVPQELPSQTGNAGKYLYTDGTNPSWENVDTTSFNPTPTVFLLMGA